MLRVEGELRHREDACRRTEAEIPRTEGEARHAEAPFRHREGLRRPTEAPFSTPEACPRRAEGSPRLRFCSNNEEFSLSGRKLAITDRVINLK